MEEAKRTINHSKGLIRPVPSSSFYFLCRRCHSSNPPYLKAEAALREVLLGPLPSSDTFYQAEFYRNRQLKNFLLRTLNV